MTGAPKEPREGSPFDPDDVAALTDQREFLLASLADLDREHEAGDLDEDDYQTLRDDYTARAAAVLRSLEAHREVSAVVPAARRRVGRTIAVAAAVVAFAVLAGFLVAGTSGARKPGESLSGAGAIPQSATSRAQACVALTQQALQASGGALATEGVAALKCYDDVLKSAPGNPVAHAYRGWTAALMARRLDGMIPTENVASLVTRATEDLQAARTSNPTYADAIVFSAITKLWQGDRAGAQSELAAFDALGLPASNEMSQLVGTLLRPQLAEPEATTVPVPDGTTVPPATAGTPAP